MPTEDHYKNREIDEKFKDILGRFDAQDNILVRIEAQTTKTNGRVTDLEKNTASRKDVDKLKIWQGWVFGFCAAVVMLVLPVLFKLFIA